MSSRRFFMLCWTTAMLAVVVIGTLVAFQRINNINAIRAVMCLGFLTWVMFFIINTIKNRLDAVDAAACFVMGGFSASGLYQVLMNHNGDYALAQFAQGVNILIFAKVFVELFKTLKQKWPEVEG